MTNVCGCCGQMLPERPSPTQVVAAEYPGLPVAEMLSRGWLGDDEGLRDANDLRRRICAFFGVETTDALALELGTPGESQ